MVLLFVRGVYFQKNKYPMKCRHEITEDPIYYKVGEFAILFRERERKRERECGIRKLLKPNAFAKQESFKALPRVLSPYFRTNVLYMAALLRHVNSSQLKFV